MVSKHQTFTPELARSAGLAENRFPETNEEADIVEDVLTKELEKLSMAEHEKILFDVHGFSRTQDEDPQDVEKYLQIFEDELRKIRRKKKEAYERAKFLNPAYVEDKAFRLMFLRAELFKPKKAAQTMITHFEIKRRVFGNGDILARDVRQSDLNQDDLSYLQDGMIQVLPERDAAGRAVLCLNLAFRRHDELVSPLSRAVWYFQMAVMKDEDAQKMGVVFVMYNYCRQKEEAVDFQREIHQLRLAMPYSVHAAHYCYNDKSLRPFVAGIRLFVDPNTRFRLRPHYGTPQEIDFELQTFGIPTEHSPMQNGDWSVEWHLEWLNIQRTREEEKAAAAEEVGVPEGRDSAVIVPRRFDVLFGRGKIAKTHTGNLRALHLCEMNYPRYESAITGKYGKTEVAEQIVRIIHESGGRFLKPENGGWVEVEDEAAREKISHFFRHMRFKVKNSASENDASNVNDSKGKTNHKNKADSDLPDEARSTGKKLTPAKQVTPCPSPALIQC